jgi:hypothetical protein
VQAAHPCTVSAHYGAALASARLADDSSSLAAMAGSGRAPKGGHQRDQLLARPDVRAAPRAGTMRTGRPGQSPSGRGNYGRAIRCWFLLA